MRVKFFIISVLMTCTFSLFAQEVISVKSELSCDSIAIGEQLMYEFSVETGKETVYDFPVFYDTITEGIEILDLISVDTSFEEEIKFISAKYLVTSFEKGLNVVPPMTVQYSFGLLQDTAYSLPIALTVITPVIDTTLAIKPIKPPVNTPVSFREALPWVLIGLGTLIVLAAITWLIWFLIKRKKNPELFKQKPREPAHIIALRDLDKLKKDKLMESKQAKKYYSRLTEIIRRYISDQYGVQAMERTSAQIMDEFKMVNKESVNLNDMLEALLQLADLVKFAKEDPLRKEKEQHLNDAYHFVNETHTFFEEEIEEESKDSTPGIKDEENKAVE